MSANNPVDILCRYRIKPGKDTEFQALLTGHWKVLHDLGLATDEPAHLLRASDRAGNVAYIEQFSWKTQDSAGVRPHIAMTSTPALRRAFVCPSPAQPVPMTTARSAMN